MTNNITDEKLLELAKEASKNAYVPFSNFKVGACVLFESGNYYTGCNVENSSYGLTLCAERNAISNAIASGETSGIDRIAIFSPNTKLCSPCGACRQWILEFQRSSASKVILQGENDDILTIKIDDLLPLGFKF